MFALIYDVVAEGMRYEMIVLGGRGAAMIARARRIPQRMRRWAFSARTLLPLPIAVDIGGHERVLLTARGAMAEAAWSRVASLRHGVDFLIRAVQPGMVMVDVGAGGGLFALAVSRRVQSCKVIATESDPILFGLLQANLALNSRSHVTCISISLNCRPEDEAVCEVGATLSDIFRSQSLAQVNVIRLEVGGAERLVLERSRDLLERADAPLLLYDADARSTARWGYHPVETVWLLRSCGYAMFMLDPGTGIIQRADAGTFDGLIVAVKPGHASYRHIGL